MKKHLVQFMILDDDWSRAPWWGVAVGKGFYQFLFIAVCGQILYMWWWCDSNFDCTWWLLKVGHWLTIYFEIALLLVLYDGCIFFHLQYYFWRSRPFPDLNWWVGFGHWEDKEAGNSLIQRLILWGKMCKRGAKIKVWCWRRSGAEVFGARGSSRPCFI